MMTGLAILVIVVLGAVVYFQHRAIDNFTALAQQTKQIGNQNHQLATDNQSIAKQNRSYTRCLATVFAQYTHDFVPITIQNLDTCTIDSQSRATNNTSAGGTAPATNNQQRSSSPSTNKAASPSQPSQAPANPQGNNSGSSPLLVSPVSNPILCNLNPAVVGCK